MSKIHVFFSIVTIKLSNNNRICWQIQQKEWPRHIWLKKKELSPKRQEVENIELRWSAKTQKLLNSQETSKTQVSHLYYNYELSNYQKVIEFAKKFNKKSSSYRICWNLVIFYFKEHVCFGLLAVLAYYQLLRYYSSFSCFLAEGMLAVDRLPLVHLQIHSNETQSLSLSKE